MVGGHSSHVNDVYSRLTIKGRQNAGTRSKKGHLIDNPQFELGELVDGTLPGRRK